MVSPAQRAELERIARQSRSARSVAFRARIVLECAGGASNAAVAANSATLINSIGFSKSLHADFGSGLYAGAYIGIPFNTVSGTQPKINVVIDAYAGPKCVIDMPGGHDAPLTREAAQDIVDRINGSAPLYNCGLSETLANRRIPTRAPMCCLIM